METQGGLGDKKRKKAAAGQSSSKSYSVINLGVIAVLESFATVQVFNPTMYTSAYGLRLQSLVEVNRAWSQGCMVVSPNSGRIVGVGLQLAVIPQIPPRLGGNKLDLALQVARDTLCLAIVRAKNGTLSIFSQCASHVINPKVDGCGDRGRCRISAI